MKSILIGFDAFDPIFFEQLHESGKTPNLSGLLGSGQYSHFSVTNPPQSEVSWTSIATGLNPGGHGIFDFVHRNPENYGMYVSLLPTKSSVLGTQFTQPHDSETIFDSAVKDGYPATSLWWPTTFPARLQSPVRTVPGLGVPDIFGQLGVGISYAMEPAEDSAGLKTRTAQLHRQKPGFYTGSLDGPTQQGQPSGKNMQLDFDLSVVDDTAARLKLGKQVHDLKLGQWSKIIEIKFKINFLVSLKIVTRVILTRLAPDPVLYFVPLQLHPLSSPWPYGTPKRMLKQIWQKQGPYLTLGWPQDTTALEEGFITDGQFLDLCNDIFEHRKRTLLSMLDSFNEGVLGCVFDSLDRIQHMFWKDRPDVIESWYLKLDALVGEINRKIAARPDLAKHNLLFVSDHGFQNFDFKVSLNRWLVNQGYLNTTSGSTEQNLSVANWQTSQAYAIGLNSLYLNLQGREGQGTVAQGQAQDLLQTLRSKLMEWKGPDGNQVIQEVLTNEEAFSGPYARYGPDLVIGYAPKYRASSETGLGSWNKNEIEQNTDHWGADHCIAAKAVPGVIFTNQNLDAYSEPSYADIPAMTIGKSLSPRTGAVSPKAGGEDQDALEERLKGLGYL